MVDQVVYVAAAAAAATAAAAAAVAEGGVSAGLRTRLSKVPPVTVRPTFVGGGGSSSSSSSSGSISR